MDERPLPISSAATILISQEPLIAVFVDLVIPAQSMIP